MQIHPTIAGLRAALAANPTARVAFVPTMGNLHDGHISLMRQAQAVKKGVAAAGGTPREFCTITVTDGLAMGHQGMKSSLVSREVIADSVELTMRGHSSDALVGLADVDRGVKTGLGSGAELLQTWLLLRNPAL